MKHKTVTLLYLILAAHVLMAWTPPLGDAHYGESESQTLRAPQSTIDPHAIMALISSSRVDSALRVLNSDEHADTRDPMVLLLKARAMRAAMSDEDDDKSLIKDETEPIHSVLDRAVELCDEALDRKASDPVYLYYRGRAHLGKAQLFTLTRSHWGAGRSASRAKGDLEKFLEMHPEHPDANGDLGAFLYFADTLPGVIKFISKFLLIPGGDREEGLERLEFAASHPGVFVTDYKIAIAAIYFIFEGRFELGTDTMIDVIDEYPYYLRLVEPLGVVAPLYPLRITEFQAIEDRMVERHLARNDATPDTRLLKAIQYHRAFTNMFFTGPSQSIREFDALIENPPDRPDWILPLLILNRGFFHLKMGKKAEAEKAFKSVHTNDRMKHFRDASKGLLASVSSSHEAINIEDIDFIRWIYDGRVFDSDNALQRYKELYGEDAFYFFYYGENRIFAQDFVAAAKAYQSTLDIDANGGNQTYQMFAALRLAEIHGHELRYGTAKEYIDKAKKYQHQEYLVDFMINARKRYYELLESGTLTTPPSMLLRGARNPLSPTQPAQH